MIFLIKDIVYCLFQGRVLNLCVKLSQTVFVLSRTQVERKKYWENWAIYRWSCRTRSMNKFRQADGWHIFNVRVVTRTLHETLLLVRNIRSINVSSTLKIDWFMICCKTRCLSNNPFHCRTPSLNKPVEMLWTKWTIQKQTG